MPPDVFLALASSGLTFIASLMFLVAPPVRRPEPLDDPRLWVPFCLPPLRAHPPPLPLRTCAVNVSTPALHSVMTLRAESGEWEITLECAPHADAAALQVHGDKAYGAVTDIRWHGRAGLVRTTKSQWRLKPGRA